ncbi:hypothetical protein FNV43_RR00125 [Rhamnella rubrinervis]|uniref:Uncharacterized protein n=1 Tax=Rhamnella rubrinervis TaxID=2594499 RepID=A0A8K0MQW8_9ROSA|nr:hypothetical protein FNV43_RR00125 [Rhamnella rubrinervis]
MPSSSFSSLQSDLPFSSLLANRSPPPRNRRSTNRTSSSSKSSALHGSWNFGSFPSQQAFSLSKKALEESISLVPRSLKLQKNAAADTVEDSGDTNRSIPIKMGKPIPNFQNLVITKLAMQLANVLGLFDHFQSTDFPNNFSPAPLPGKSEAQCPLSSGSKEY